MDLQEAAQRYADALATSNRLDEAERAAREALAEATSAAVEAGTAMRRACKDLLQLAGGDDLTVLRVT